MNVYLDTSAIVPLVIHEVTTARATLLWERADRCASSVLADVETQAALAQARRQGRLDDDQLALARRQLDELLRQMVLFDVTRPIVARAGVLAADEGLRAYDAVHLASAELAEADELVLVTGDRLLARAAGRQGLGVADLHSDNPTI